MVFSLFVLDDSTVLLSGYNNEGQDTLSWDPSNNSTDSVTFSGIWDKSKYGGPTLTKNLIYNHENGNITYRESGIPYISHGYTNFSGWVINVTTTKGNIPVSLLRNYTSKIAGTRSWFWGQSVGTSFGALDSVTYSRYSNVVFGITVIDDTTLKTDFFQLESTGYSDSFEITRTFILNYVSLDSVAQSVTFRSNQYYVYGNSLTYYYLKDSISLTSLNAQYYPWMEIKMLTQ